MGTLGEVSKATTYVDGMISINVRAMGFGHKDDSLNRSHQEPDRRHMKAASNAGTLLSNLQHPGP